MKSLQDASKNYKRYIAYAYTICKCNTLKKDLVNDMFIKLDGILKKNPVKEISDGYIYLILKSIYLNSKRKQTIVIVEDKFLEILSAEQHEDVVLDKRKTIDEALSLMKFSQREILLRTQEESLRKVAKRLNISHCMVNNKKQEALLELKNILCQNKVRG